MEKGERAPMFRIRLASRRTRTLTAGAVAAAVALGLSACGSSDSGSSSTSGSTTVNVGGFSVIKSAYDDLGQQFAKTPAGKGVKFTSSYGASGAQSRAVIAGQKADLVAFSLAPDLTNVADAGLVDKSWTAAPPRASHRARWW